MLDPITPLIAINIAAKVGSSPSFRPAPERPIIELNQRFIQYMAPVGEVSTNISPVEASQQICIRDLNSHLRNPQVRSILNLHQNRNLSIVTNSGSGKKALQVSLITASPIDENQIFCLVDTNPQQVLPNLHRLELAPEPNVSVPQFCNAALTDFLGPSHAQGLTFFGGIINDTNAFCDYIDPRYILNLSNSSSRGLTGAPQP